MGTRADVVLRLAALAAIFCAVEARAQRAVPLVPVGAAARGFVIAPAWHSAFSAFAETTQGKAALGSDAAGFAAAQMKAIAGLQRLEVTPQQFAEYPPARRLAEVASAMELTTAVRKDTLTRAAELSNVLASDDPEERRKGPDLALALFTTARSNAVFLDETDGHGINTVLESASRAFLNQASAHAFNEATETARRLGNAATEDSPMARQDASLQAPLLGLTKPTGEPAKTRAAVPSPLVNPGVQAAAAIKTLSSLIGKAGAGVGEYEGPKSHYPLADVWATPIKPGADRVTVNVSFSAGDSWSDQYLTLIGGASPALFIGRKDSEVPTVVGQENDPAKRPSRVAAFDILEASADKVKIRYTQHGLTRTVLVEQGTDSLIHWVEEFADGGRVKLKFSAR